MMSFRHMPFWHMPIRHMSQFAIVDLPYDVRAVVETRMHANIANLT